ncbi:MAG: metallophosphoesterase [Actinobacteria bacterium]|nr:metallophosphoesterase [Actinomycetota bacterium]
MRRKNMFLLMLLLTIHQPQLTVMLIVMVGSSLLFLLWYYSFRFEVINFRLVTKNINVTPVKSNKNYRMNNNYNCNGGVYPFLKILHLSDFHLRKDRKGKKLFSFLKSLSQQEVDLIFITGDLVERNENIEYLTRMLSVLRAKYGKYAVLGVHDYYNKTPAEFIRNMFKKKRRYKRENNVDHLISELNNTGIKVLRNESVSVLINSKTEKKPNKIKRIKIIGLDDPIIEKIDIKKAFGEDGESTKSTKNTCKERDFMKSRQLRKALLKETFNLNKTKIHRLNSSEELRIALIHTPDQDSLAEIAKRGVDIVFSGHTHGGQVRLPLIGALVSGCKIKTKFAEGLFYFKRFVLHVSKGLGEGRYSQFRFFCQPEASIININLPRRKETL